MYSTKLFHLIYYKFIVCGIFFSKCVGTMATTWKSVREVRALSVALVSIDQETIQALAETHQENINDLIVAKMKVDILKAKQ